MNLAPVPGRLWLIAVMAAGTLPWFLAQFFTKRCGENFV